MYVTLIPALVVWQKHPQLKRLFIAAVVVDALMFLSWMFFALRWWIRQLRAQT